MESLNPKGWIIMLGSLALVWGLTIWCYAKLLSVRGRERDGE